MQDYREESIAYALATGLYPGGAPLFDSSHQLLGDIDRKARRDRWERRKARKSEARFK